MTYDRTAYRGHIVIERAFNGFKHRRGLATRYDKDPSSYRGGLVLAAVLLWLTDLGDTSRWGEVPPEGSSGGPSGAP